MTESEYCTLYTQQRDKAVAYCSHLLNGQTESAEDCTQIAFMCLWTDLKSNKPIAKPKAYLFATLRHIVKQRQKDEIKQREICKRLSHRQPCQDTEIDKTPLISARYDDGYTQTEIAQQTGVCQQTVSRRLARDMSELREGLTNA